MVKLREVFPHGTGFVLVFEYMLSDLSEVKGVCFCTRNKNNHSLIYEYVYIVTHGYQVINYGTFLNMTAGVKTNFEGYRN